MKNWVDNLVSEYYDWLRQETTIFKDEQTGWFAVDTPFVGLFNDTVTIYIKQIDKEIVLSDDNETLDNLELVGVKIGKEGKRKEIIDSILINYGIKLQNNELFVTANEKNFSQKKHNFISAILEVNNLYVLSKNNVSHLFKEDVRKFLEEENIIFTPEFAAKGSVTNLDFTFDFQIAGKSTELVIKSFGNLTKPLISHFLFSWEDIKPTRERMIRKNVKALAIINDEKNVKTEYLEALKSKNSEIMLWSNRYNEKEKLAA